VGGVFMLKGDNWFTEIEDRNGIAFSLRIKQKLHEEKTPYQLIEIFETESFGNLMVLDGCIMLSQKENFIYHEMVSHPVLFTHPNPENVLIIGGGDCGTLKEVLKHQSVRRVYQIDIDEQVTRLSEKYFPELCVSNNDVRAELLFVDGIKWVQQSAPQSYDVIIVDSTDPIGPGEGLFAQSFYESCHAALGENGLLIQQSESPLIHQLLLRDMHKSMRLAEYDDVKTFFFPQMVYPSGWWSGTIAKKQGVLSGFREQESKNNDFNCEYYNHDVHKAAFAMPSFFKNLVS